MCLNQCEATSTVSVAARWYLNTHVLPRSSSRPFYREWEPSHSATGSRGTTRGQSHVQRTQLVRWRPHRQHDLRRLPAGWRRLLPGKIRQNQKSPPFSSRLSNWRRWRHSDVIFLPSVASILKLIQKFRICSRSGVFWLFDYWSLTLSHMIMMCLVSPQTAYMILPSRAS
jgi:hypothetical protein